MKNPLIAASILSANFANLGSEVKEVIKAGSDWIHVDVMDGHFVPNITIGPLVVEALKKECPNAYLDVHLMISEPEKYISEFAKAGASMIAVHQEASIHLHKNIQLIKDCGAKAAVVLNPATPIQTLENILSDIDMILLMSVNPGFGGQKFIPETLKKCSELARLRSEKNLSFLIEIDGGVNEKTAAELKKAGANVLVAGNAIFKAGDYKTAIDKIRNA